MTNITNLALPLVRRADRLEFGIELGHALEDASPLAIRVDALADLEMNRLLHLPF